MVEGINPRSIYRDESVIFTAVDGRAENRNEKKLEIKIKAT